MKIINRKDVSIIVTIIWMGIIFYLSHQPESESSELSSRFLLIIEGIITYLHVTINVDLLHFLIRKSAHFIAYFILGILIIRTLQIGRKINVRFIVLAFSIGVLYAISDELHQLFIPGRSGEFRDVIIDSVGASLGIIFYIMIIAIKNKNIVNK